MIQASLFSGVEGFGLAAAWMGWETAFCCEINEFCIPILKYYFPNSEHYGDIKKTDFTKWRGKIDILTGGFPCQPFSVAGDRKGADDDRYLWPEMLRAIREIRPTWIVGENVAGIISMVQPGDEIEVEHQASLFEEDNQETILEQEYVTETICRSLEYEGYSVQPLVIPACAVGAPHRRDRIWFIANRSDAGPESMQSGRKNRVHKSKTVTYSNCDRNTRQPGNSNRKKKNKEVREELQCEITGCRGQRVASHSDKLNGDISGFCTSRVSQFEASGVRENNDEYTNGQRCKEFNSLSIADKKAKFGSIRPNEVWLHWPTQPPVCRRDDGLSLRLDGITFSRWRNESIKSFGNAIVPQVYLEICKAIEIVSDLQIP